MSSQKIHRSILVSGLIFFSTPNFAFEENQVVTARRVNEIQDQQAKSIKDGVKVGKLTPKEARKLRDEQYEISALERDMRANGSLNAKELSELFKRLEKARNNINKLLRNNISTHGGLENIDSSVSEAHE